MGCYVHPQNGRTILDTAGSPHGRHLSSCMWEALLHRFSVKTASLSITPALHKSVSARLRLALCVCARVQSCWNSRYDGANFGIHAGAGEICRRCYKQNLLTSAPTSSQSVVKAMQYAPTSGTLQCCSPKHWGTFRPQVGIASILGAISEHHDMLNYGPTTLTRDSKDISGKPQTHTMFDKHFAKNLASSSS